MKRFTRRQVLKSAGVAGAGLALGAGPLSQFFTYVPRASAAGADTPVRGGSLRVGITGDWSTLDPSHYINISERQIFYSIYTPLFSQSPSFSIAPGLVKSWTVSPDGLRLTFRLQDGVRFHDGTPCDADAVKFNIDRMLNPATGSAFRTILAPIREVRVVNPATLELALTAPFTPLLAWFTEGPGFISSPTAIRKWGDQYALRPVGTGPFEFVEWVKNDHITLKRFSGYWEQGLPDLDEIVYRPMGDETVKMANLRAGGLDVVDVIPAREQHAFRGDRRFHTTVLPGANWPMIRLNNAMPPFNNKALRQAVSYAVNRDQVVTTIYFDQARPAYGPISPVYREYYDPSVSRYGYHHDLQKARAKLAEGGQPNGFTFTLEIFASPEQTRLAELIKAQLGEAGITANIRAYEITTLIDRVTGKRYQAAIGSWTPRPDIDGTMYNHFSTHGNVNSVSYNNPTVDSLFEKTRMIPSGPERIRLYREIQRLIIEDAPWVFLGFLNLMIGTRAEVQGVPAIPDGIMRFKGAWLRR
jgi:peptide/nickel transport system substrate-binding protein